VPTIFTHGTSGCGFQFIGNSVGSFPEYLNLAFDGAVELAVLNKAGK